MIMDIKHSNYLDSACAPTKLGEHLLEFSLINFLRQIANEQTHAAVINDYNFFKELFLIKLSQSA
jgi:hypothetical protein